MIFLQKIFTKYISCYNVVMVRLKKAAIVSSTIFGASLLTVCGFRVYATQSSTTLEFTFEPTLSLSISNTNLAVNDLTPGTFGTSNNITVTVNTNNISGYHLTAAVGNDTDYLNTNLVNANTSFSFTSLSTSASVSTISTDNTWGYTVDSGTSYSGLPHYSASTWKTLKQTDNNTDEKTVSFGIGAKASLSMVSGDYQNIIQFRVVANPVPNEGN